MTHFTRKPITIEAVQYDGTNLREVIDFTDGKAATQFNLTIEIPTPKGKQIVNSGDWVIKSASGELTQCTDEEFTQLYFAGNFDSEHIEKSIREGMYHGLGSVTENSGSAIHPGKKKVIIDNAIRHMREKNLF